MSFINKELLIQRATALNSNIEIARQYYNSVYNLIVNMPIEDAEKVTRCYQCKFGRPIDRTKSPEKYFREDCVVCECEDVVGDEPVVYPNEHYCSFGKVNDGC